jgi:hypothetical protein
MKGSLQGPLHRLGVVAQIEICESARRSGSRGHKMGEYSDRVKAEIASDNVTRKFIYVSFALIMLLAIFMLRGFATVVVVLGLGLSGITCGQLSRLFRPVVLPDLWLVIQDHIQQGVTDFDFSVVFDIAQFTKFIHEKTHA